MAKRKGKDSKEGAQKGSDAPTINEASAAVVHPAEPQSEQEALPQEPSASAEQAPYFEIEETVSGDNPEAAPEEQPVANAEVAQDSEIEAIPVMPKLGADLPGEASRVMGSTAPPKTSAKEMASQVKELTHNRLGHRLPTDVITIAVNRIFPTATLNFSGNKIIISEGSDSAELEY